MELPEWLNQDQLVSLMTVWGLKLLAALAVLVIGWIAVGLICRGIARSFAKSKLDATLSTFLVKVAYAILLTIVVIAALNQLGVEMTSALAILGAAGLAIALSLQGSLSNFASGTMLVAARPMKVGDFVDCAGVSGVVDHIGIFYTQLHTVDNQVITIANSLVLQQPLINYSSQDKRRFNETIGIAYGDDIDEAKSAITRVLRSESRLLDEPPPEVLVVGLGASSVDLAVRCWIRSSEFWDVRSDLLQNLKTGLEAAGISIPFPQQDVHLFRHDGGVQTAQTSGAAR